MASPDIDDVAPYAARGRRAIAATPEDGSCTAGRRRVRAGRPLASRPKPRGRMDRARRLAEVLDLVFDAALDPAAWPRALDGLADATGASMAALGSYDPRTNAMASLAPRQDPEYIRLYR